MRPALRGRGVARSARPAFTLVELLVVIGIIAVLAGLLLPAVLGMGRSAARAKIAMDLQAIGSALNAYQQDHKIYPPVTGPPVAANNGLDGATVLKWALIGKTGTGFKTSTRANEKNWGPYLQADQFKFDDNGLIDREERHILYFPASPSKPNVRVPATGGGTQPYADGTDGGGTATAPSSDFARFDLRDNYGTAPNGLRRDNDANALLRFRLMLRDTNANGYIDPGENPAEVPYVLWSAGPDGLFGPEMRDEAPIDVLDQRDAQRCDDVLNIPQ